jgi:hypothetical protein
MPQSLTYAEMADALNITPGSASRLAHRRRWPRIKGEDGRTRVSVPEEALGYPDSLQTILPDNQAHARLVIALENHIKTLRDENEELRQQLAAERDRSLRTLAAFADLAVRLDALAAREGAE